MNEILLKTFSQRLNEARERAGLSLADVGRLLSREYGLNVSSSIYAWARGDYFPRADAIYALGRVLGVSVDWLFGDGDPPPPPQAPRPAPTARQKARSRTDGRTDGGGYA